MNAIIIVIIYTLSASGGHTKTEYAQPVSSLAVCEVLVEQIKIDRVLNTPTSYVFSAECEKRG